jgi:carbon storage regulator
VLVLTRRANQSIMIGDDVVVTVLDVRGDQVRIGIKAPRSVDVHREEVYIALQRDAAREANAEADEEQVIDLSDDHASALPGE